MTTPAPAPQQEATIHIPVKTTAGVFYVFCAGDLIDPAVKASVPEWGDGGVLRPEAHTLKYQGGYVRRCEITALRPYATSERAAFIHPAERKHLHATLDMQVGDEVRKLGQQFVKQSDSGMSRPVASKEYSNGTAHDGLLRTPFYPIDEIDRLTNQGDGLVKMPCSSQIEAAAAQAFLFPNWEEIASGAETIPHKMAALRAYFAERLKASESEFENKVASAAIKSCDEFRAWGVSETGIANSTYKAMAVKGYTWSYAGVTELLFSQLGIQRQDTIAQEQGDKLDRLTDSIAKFVEASIGRPAPAEGQPSEVGDAAVTQEDLAEFFAWRADQVKTGGQQDDASSEKAKAADFPVGSAVTVEDGRIGSVVQNTGLSFGNVKVAFASGEEVQFRPATLKLIPEA